ncbi:hypothetical protein R1sor_007960 [Riccia sorocarpa]|uniref:Uncharacterized protein n=1 Tax=Riccia sorocarpa TaxID=122646 RepID=A0ABD3HYA6_9MARC
MGMEVPFPAEEETPTTESEVVDLRILATRPSILLVGPPAVGKRSLLNRLVAKKPSSSDSLVSGVSCHGWTIDTKYYTADVCVWMGRLDSTFVEDSSYEQPQYGRSEALVMVFDLSKDSTFKELQEWTTKVQLENFEILLCVGNKADHVPDHFAHAEYRRKLQKGGESSSDPHPEYFDYGIDRSEGSGLLEEESEPAEDGRRSRIEWCAERGIEYIEACAINEVFDKCMSVDGDLQGVARIHGALTAHMWPGLVMKDSNQRSSSQPGDEDSTSDDDSDYYVEYELLSNGSAEPWDGSGWEEQWTQAPAAQDERVVETNGDAAASNGTAESHNGDSVSAASPAVGVEQSSNEPQHVQVDNEVVTERNGTVESTSEGENESRRDNDASVGLNTHVESDYDAIEQLMNEMASMRENMRNVSDQRRREMAAQLAMRMAAMFNDDDEEGNASE